MKYVANPVIVNAYKIKEIENIVDSNALNLVLEDGEEVLATEEITAKMIPVVDDYWVIQSDGYIYLNPKDVFERKYSLIYEENKKMTDTFRKEYRPLDESQKSRINQIKSEAEKLNESIDWAIGDKRMIALAKENLELAVMWAIKSIT